MAKILFCHPMFLNRSPEEQAAGSPYFPLGLPITALLDLFDRGQLTAVSLQQEPDIAFSENGRVIINQPRPPIENLDTLPLPARDLIDMDRYLNVWQEINGYTSLTISTTRGCPYGCEWCQDAVHGPDFRQRSPESVAAEMKMLKETYKIDRLRIIDDVDGIEREWLDDWAEAAAERTAVETDFIENQRRLPAGARILEVGCGFGRHSIELARRGYAVTGIDPAAAMIATAQERAEEAAVSVDFQQAYGEQFTTDTPFDVAICLFTSLGQMGPDGDNSDLVRQVHDALKPGGLFVVELPQRETAVSQLRPSDQIGVGERYTAVTRQYNATDQTITEIFRLVAPEETRMYTLRYRLYSRAELFRAGVGTVPQEYVDAARSLGAGQTAVYLILSVTYTTLLRQIEHQLNRKSSIVNQKS